MYFFLIVVSNVRLKKAINKEIKIMYLYVYNVVSYMFYVI